MLNLKIKEEKKEDSKFSFSFLCLNPCKEKKECLFNYSLSDFFEKKQNLSRSPSFSKIGINNLQCIKKHKKKFSLIEFPKEKLFHLIYKNYGILAKITSKNLSVKNNEKIK